MEAVVGIVIDATKVPVEFVVVVVVDNALPSKVKLTELDAANPVPVTVIVSPGAVVLLLLVRCDLIVIERLAVFVPSVALTVALPAGT